MPIKKPQYRDKKYQQIMKMNISDTDRMSDQTLKNNFVRANRFLDWLCAKYSLSLPHKEVLQIRLDARPQSETDVYESGELRKIFTAQEYIEAKHKKAAYFWTPLLALFTGARMEELCQLYVEDIRQGAHRNPHTTLLPGICMCAVYRAPCVDSR